MLLKLFAAVGQGALAMEQVPDESRQYVERGIDEVLRFVQLVWTWSSDQFVNVAHAQWETWPLWKQILFIVVIAAVVYFLFIAARQLWAAAINVLAAFATFVGTVIVTLPTILIAGFIALAGLWIINNFHDLSDLRSLITFQSTSSEKSP
jgi:cytochrome bd-type quinol oxidase subunit 2